MAWDDHECGGVWILSGDTPFDHLGAAMKRLHKAFLERWGRPPYLAELLYPLLSIVTLQPNSLVADEQLPSLESLISFVGGPTKSDHIEPGEFQGAQEESSGDFVIFPANGGESPESVVVRAEVIDSEDRTLLCRYELHSLAINDRMAKCLIRDCVLRGLLRYDLTDPDLVVRFERRSP